MQKIKLFKGTVNEIASDPPFKNYKFDHNGTLYLSNNQ